MVRLVEWIFGPRTRRCRHKKVQYYLNNRVYCKCGREWESYQAYWKEVKMKRSLLFLLLLLPWLPVRAASVGIEWDYPVGSNATGFYFYYSPTSAQYTTARIDLCPCDCTDPESDGTLLCRANVTTLPDLPRLYFTMTAYNEAGESLRSNEIFKDYVSPPVAPVLLRRATIVVSVVFGPNGEIKSLDDTMVGLRMVD